jgi:ABC-type sugar transport system substrate-binding protein
VKKLLVLAVSFLSVAFLVSAVLSVGFWAGLDRVWVTPSPGAAPSLAVAFLLPAERDPFWDALVADLRKAGEPRRYGFEVYRYASTGTNIRELLEKASLSRVNAVLCFPPDSDDLTDVVNAAEGRGVPVFLLENDLPNSKRRVFFGASPFQLGHSIGRLISQTLPQARRGGVLLSQTSLDRQTVRNSLFLNGLNEGLSRSEGEFQWEEVISPPGRFAGEELVWSFLREPFPPQVLVTSNAKDTSGALQTIVEANRVGRTRLIGVGEDPGLRAALEQGLVAGLLTRDAQEWAGILFQNLDASLHGGSVSSYVNLPVHALTPPGEVHGD